MSTESSTRTAAESTWGEQRVMRVCYLQTTLIAQLRHWTSPGYKGASWHFIVCTNSSKNHLSLFKVSTGKTKMSKNLSTTTESNPEVMSEGDKECAYLTFYKHANGTLAMTVFQRALQVAECQISFGMTAVDVDIEMVYSRSSARQPCEYRPGLWGNPRVPSPAYFRPLVWSLRN